MSTVLPAVNSAASIEEIRGSGMQMSTTHRPSSGFNRLSKVCDRFVIHAIAFMPRCGLAFLFQATGL